MKKIKFLIFLLALSSCNKYLGTVDPDYTPTNEVTEIFSDYKIINYMHINFNIKINFNSITCINCVDMLHAYAYMHIIHCVIPIIYMHY